MYSVCFFDTIKFFNYMVKFKGHMLEFLNDVVFLPLKMLRVFCVYIAMRVL